MITNRSIYNDYLHADRIANGMDQLGKKARLQDFLFPNPIWVFLRRLRKAEYYKNCKTDFLSKVYYVYLKYKLKKIAVKLSFSIPQNAFGPGLSLPHYGTIIVNPAARIGRNCRMHACTNIGASGGSKIAPRLGDNVYIAPGVKIFGEITIASNCAISANSTVNKNFEEEHILIAGSPAKRIKEMDINLVIPFIEATKHLAP